MAQSNEERRNQVSKGIDYTERIQKAKEPFKNEVLKFATKEEKILYLNAQKQRYTLLKENSNNVYFMSILISFFVIISIILLLTKTERSVLFISIMFTLIIISGIIWTVMFITMKNTSTNYTIILFALEELKEKVEGSLSGGYDDMRKLKEVLDKMNSEIGQTKQQVKEGYSMVEQKIKELSK